MAQVKRGRKAMSDINVVPYIDVMLVLLVIFMVTAPLLPQGIKVELPKAADEPIDLRDLKDQQPIVLSGFALLSSFTLMPPPSLLKSSSPGSSGARRPRAWTMRSKR